MIVYQCACLLISINIKFHTMKKILVKYFVISKYSLNFIECFKILNFTELSVNFIEYPNQPKSYVI